MYKDYELISEDKMLELKKAYDLKLFSVKTFSSENANFIELFNESINLLNITIHYITNLINLSKNLENLKILKEINLSLETSKENLLNLYEISEIYEKPNENKNLNYVNNLKNVIENIIAFVENLITINNIETNIKIKSILNNIIFQNLNNLKNLNALYLNTNNYKIFSLFKNKY